MFWPRSSTRPPRITDSLVLVLGRLLFPAPFGPMMQAISPARKRSEIPAMTGSRPYPAVRSSTRNRGASVRFSANEVGLLHVVVTTDLLHRALVQDPPSRHHDDGITKPLDDLQLVLDHENGHALAPVLQEDILYPCPDGAVDPGHRLF